MNNYIPKKIIIPSVIFLLLILAVYATEYRQPSGSIYALSLVKDNRTFFVPKNRLACTENDVCQFNLNGDNLQVEVDFQPADAPFGQCRASYGDVALTCAVKQRYYYQFGQTIRPYLEIEDREDNLSLTRWQVGRFSFETVLANLALGDETSWSVIIGLVAFAICISAFASIRRTLFHTMPLQLSIQSKGAIATSLTFIVCLLLIVIAWFGGVLLLTASGIIVD